MSGLTLYSWLWTLNVNLMLPSTINIIYLSGPFTLPFCRMTTSSLPQLLLPHYHLLILTPWIGIEKIERGQHIFNPYSLLSTSIGYTIYDLLLTIYHLPPNFLAWSYHKGSWESKSCFMSQVIVSTIIFHAIQGRKIILDYMLDKIQNI